MGGQGRGGAWAMGGRGKGLQKDLHKAIAEDQSGGDNHSDG